MGLSPNVWIVDDGPLDMLAAEVDVDQVRAWPPGMLCVADETWRSSTDPGSRRQLLLGAATPTGVPVWKSFDVPVAGEAARVLYGHLRKDRASAADLAEHQAIVWALLFEQRAVLVTGDKAAATLALAELGRSKVCHPIEFWHNMKEDQLVTPQQWESLCQRWLRADRACPGVPWRYQ